MPKIEISEGGAIPKKDDVGLFTAWRVAFTGAIAIIIALVWFKPDPYLEIVKFLPDGVLVTFKVIFINETAALIWLLCDGQRNVAEIKAILREAYPQDTDSIENDVRTIIERFDRDGAIELK